MAERHVQVVATGASPAAIAAIESDLVICADGGLDAVFAAGREAHVIVGDLDSASAAGLAGVADDVVIERAPQDKDETDLELALATAVDRSAERLTVHLAAGGRLDHQLANLVVLASPRWQAAEITAYVGDADRVFVVHGTRSIPLAVGDPFAIMPIGSPAVVTTRGVEWELTAESLDPTAARGISNQVVAAGPTVQVDGGAVLVLSSAQAT